MSVRFGYNYLKCFQFEGQAGPLEKKSGLFSQIDSWFFTKKSFIKKLILLLCEEDILIQSLLMQF